VIIRKKNPAGILKESNENVQQIFTPARADSRCRLGDAG